MPKYERFDNNLTTIITTTPSTSPASTPPATPKPPLTTTTTMMTTTDDDDDESFAMFIGNNHSIHNNSNNNNINEIHGSNYNRHNGSSGNQTNNNYNNNSNNNYNSNSNFYGNNHYSNDNHYTSHSNSNNNNHNIINNSNLMNTSNNNYNNNNSSSNNHLILDHDESTMEVPLLNNNNNCSSNNHNDPDYDDPRPVCRCEQPGFSADLSSKTTQEAKLKILLAISLCCIFMIIEFLGGYLAGSLAIMTDAAHLASDCISFVIGLVAIWLGSRPPDRQMSFGYKRTEVMGAIVSILSIWILTATLVMVAIERLYSNDFDLDANTMMTISGIGILINIVMAFILHGSSLLPGGSHGHSHAHSLSHGHSHSHTHMGHSHTHASGMHNALMDDDSDATGNGLKHIKGEKNLNLRAAMIHVIGDLVQSIGVFVASIVIKFVPSAKFADPLCTLLFSVIVIMTTVGLFKESIGILMDAVPLEVSLANLERDLEHIEGVKSVHHLNVWSHTSNHNVMMVHLVIDLLSDSNTVLDRARHLAQSHKYNIKHSTIQIERLPA